MTKRESPEGRGIKQEDDAIKFKRSCQLVWSLHLAPVFFGISTGTVKAIRKC